MRVGMRASVFIGALTISSLVARPAVAGTNSTNLANGAELSVTIDTPETGDTFLVPPGSTGVDVPVAGSASIGEGAPNVHWTYVIDVSGSTAGTCDGGNILDCEKQAVTNLNDTVAADGSAIDVGVSVFSESGAAADMSGAAGDQFLADPASPDVDTVVSSVSIGGVSQFTARNVGSGSTNFTAGLQAALDSVQASAAGFKNVVFLSDGFSNTGGGGFDAAVAALAGEGATIYSFAVGGGSSCGGGSDGTLQAMADDTGGTCTNVPDPANLPAIVENVTATELEAVALTVDGSATALDSIAPMPPFDGPGSTDFTATAADQLPGAHEVCGTATGTGPKSDPGSQQSVTQCETYYVFGFDLQPPTETNELGEDDEHTVVATVSGAPGQLAGWPVSFEVAGANAGETGVCDPVACVTDADGMVTFTYDVPVESDSLGVDLITATVDINGQTGALTVEKVWQDTTPPTATCVAGPNPAGIVPASPGGGSAQNPDGFWTLSGSDDVWADEDVEVFVTDDGSGHTFGPYANPTNIKWAEANGAQPEERPGSGAVDFKLLGQGDALVYAVDGSGNVSEPVACLVPPAPQ